MIPADPAVRGEKPVRNQHRVAMTTTRQSHVPPPDARSPIAPACSPAIGRPPGFGFIRTVNRPISASIFASTRPGPPTPTPGKNPCPTSSTTAPIAEHSIQLPPSVLSLIVPYQLRYTELQLPEPRLRFCYRFYHFTWPATAGNGWVLV